MGVLMCIAASVSLSVALLVKDRPWMSCGRAIAGTDMFVLLPVWVSFA